MTTRLADRLSAARRRRFVGRAAELELLRAALTAGTAPYLAFTDALRDLGRAVGPRAWERMRAGAAPELAGVLPGASEPAHRADDVVPAPGVTYSTV